MNSLRINTKGKKMSNHVTYIMSQTYRILDNHSLSYAVNHYDSCDIIIYRKSEAQRQNKYFNEFIKDLKEKLHQFGEVSYVEDYHDISIRNDIILDQGYLHEELELEKHIVSESKYSVSVIESNVVVPVRITSNKEEYSARTIRPKILKQINNFIDPVLEDKILSATELTAIEKTEKFINEKLPYYHLKNHPEFNYTSSLSVFLKYGIISPIRILLLLESSSHQNRNLFIEELVIRRELAFNFVFYNKKYNIFENMTYQWAYNTMKDHISDDKAYIYDIDDYINYRTHDIYFNTAMKEMVHLGKMHGYMRMYWCKKIIEWSPTYKIAYETAVQLNNLYFFDGNTPNGYTGVAWCFGKHDRAWSERFIFGKIRYMNANGLRRKFNIDEYCKKVEKEVKRYELSQTHNSN